MNAVFHNQAFKCNKVTCGLFCYGVILTDSQCHGEHMAGSTSYEVPVHQNVLLQELPQYRQDQQLHQLPELLPPKGTAKKQS